MGQTVLARLRAAVLSACFICAGIILPDLDALWFHGVRSQEEARPHVEAAGSESCHAEKCVLGASLPQGQRAGGGHPDFNRLDDPPTVVPPFAAAISDRTPSGTSDSRAPPAALVS